jgi:hypothetical protein
MPLALSPKIKINRARQLVAECRAMPEPPKGQAHGHWKIKVHSRLGRADKLIRRKTYRARDGFNGAERAQADELIAEIDALWPK